jgi:2-dehydro-3-deoxyphosphogluconate aldolase/(4S)-4-hydroxy-2-oxoglutarate aldolase
MFMPTGGVELLPDNLAQWFNAGVCAVGLGSKLITGEILKEQKFDLLQVNTQKALSLIKDNRTFSS